MPSRKVGLALGGGAARGLAHIGVLEVLERARVPIDMIAGTSIGAFIGALHAQGKDASQIRNLVLKLTTKKTAFWIDPVLPKTGLIGGRKIESTLKSIIGDIEFKDLRLPLACVATDIITGEEVVIKEGPVWEGIRASSSLPVLFAVAEREGRYLVDGGLVNTVPVSVLKTMGADFTIAVNVTPDRNEIQITEPNIFTITMQTFHIASYQRIRSTLRGADIVIEPRVGHIGLADFHRAKECILQGELAAQDSLLEIRRKYPTGFQNNSPS
ncbi:patatin-like phospholipase family protein [Chloroflexota bacterium]